MNLYFLLVALSQIFPVLRIGYLITFYGPLSCVLAVTISKEAYDDIQRHKRDKEINNQIYQKLTKDGLVDVPSSKIKVGDLIKINCNQRVSLFILIFISFFFFLIKNNKYIYIKKK